MNRKYCLFASLVVALVFITGIFVGDFFLKDLSAFSDEASQSAINRGPVLDINRYSRSVYDEAYMNAGVVEHVSARSAVTAHHLLVTDRIAELFEKIGNDETDTVVLISPNHFGAGYSKLQASQASWITPYGVVESDNEMVGRLASAVPELRIEDEAQENEHGVFGLMPFIARSFPGAKVVVLTVHATLNKDTTKEVAETVARLAPDATVIASIDMSHNLPRYVQEFHDQITLSQLAAGYFGDRIDLEIDANRVLDMLQVINEIRGDIRWNQTYHGCSIADGSVGDWKENTSHILGYFTRGERTEMQSATIHFIGDIMLDRGVRNLAQEHGIDYPWLEVDRFMSGKHLRVADLEGTVSERGSVAMGESLNHFSFTPESIREMSKHVDVVSLANNHAGDFSETGRQETREWLSRIGVEWFDTDVKDVRVLHKDINGVEVSLISFDRFSSDLTSVLDAIASAEASGSFVVVMAHWGREFSPGEIDDDRETASRMAAVGADLIIGSHPHVPQGVSLVDEVPVFWSLGNFVFDQTEPETWQALTLGVTITKSNFTVRLLPISSRLGQPSPVSDETARQIIDKLIKKSDPALAEAMTSGIMRFNYVP